MRPLGTPPSNGIAEPAGRPWRVSLHRDVAKLVVAHGIESDLFRPTIGDLIAALEIDPKRYPKKRGKMKDVRAADLRFADGVCWRAVSALDERERIVRILAFAPHDVAYDEAMRRI